MPDAPVPLEARLPCPVCLGVLMEKIVLRRAGLTLMLDHCKRCGGVWFEKGEAQQLTSFAPAELWKHIPPRPDAPRPPCHGCGAPLDRDAPKCAVCNTPNELKCPACDKTLERVMHAGLTLDVCRKCKGVWFDHAELKSIWSLQLQQLSRNRRGNLGNAAAMGGDVLLESFFWAPGLTIEAGAVVVSGVGHAVSAVGSVLSSDGAASVASGAVEVVGHAAEGLFEFIASIIASIFDN